MDFLSKIPISSVSGFIGLGLLVLGGLMILGGLDIVRIERVSVRPGRRTWVGGIILAAVGLVLLVPEFLSTPDVADSGPATATLPATAAASPGAATTSLPTAAATPAAESTAVLGEWIPVDLMIPNGSLWRDTADGIYTAVGSQDAFAWSRKAYDGNLMVSLDLESPDNRASGCVVVYGDGQDFSEGNLIFCVDWDGYGLEKHTIYHEGENYLTFVHDSVDLKNTVKSVTIEILDDVASMNVNGESVFSTFFDPEEINRSGRVALLKKWFDPEVTFSNVQIKALGAEGVLPGP